VCKDKEHLHFRISFVGFVVNLLALVTPFSIDLVCHLEISQNLVWWTTPTIAALGRLRQQDFEFKASLVYTVRLFHENKNMLGAGLWCFIHVSCYFAVSQKKKISI
jgi:hypothetical protein